MKHRETHPKTSWNIVKRGQFAPCICMYLRQQKTNFHGFQPRHLEGLDIDLDVKTPKNSDAHTPICQKRSVATKGLGQNPLIMLLRSENLEFRQHIVAWWDVHHWCFIFFILCWKSNLIHLSVSFQFRDIQWGTCRCFNFDPVPQVCGYELLAGEVPTWPPQAQRHSGSWAQWQRHISFVGHSRDLVSKQVHVAI